MLFTIVSCIAFACFLTPSEMSTFHQVKKMTLEQKEGTEIGSVRDCLIENDGTIVVVDSKMINVKIFSQTGSLVQVIGRRGEGPGEFQAPRAVCGNKQWYFVSDMMRQNVQVFDKATWKYVKTFTTYDAVEIHASDAKFWITAPHLENDTSLHAYDLNGKLLMSTLSIPSITKKNKLIASGITFDMDVNGEVIIVHQMDFTVHRMNENGKTLGEYKGKSRKYIQPPREPFTAFYSKEKIANWVASWSSIQKLCVMKGTGVTIVSFVEPATSKHFANVFDQKGKPLSLDAPTAGRLLYANNTKIAFLEDRGDDVCTLVFCTLQSKK